jgi:hypothetical protein
VLVSVDAPLTTDTAVAVIEGVGLGAVIGDDEDPQAALAPSTASTRSNRKRMATSCGFWPSVSTANALPVWIRAGSRGILCVRMSGAGNQSYALLVIVSFSVISSEGSITPCFAGPYGSLSDYHEGRFSRRLVGAKGLGAMILRVKRRRAGTERAELAERSAPMPGHLRRV